MRPTNNYLARLPGKRRRLPNKKNTKELERVLLADDLDDHYGVELNAIALGAADVNISR